MAALRAAANALADESQSSPIRKGDVWVEVPSSRSSPPPATSRGDDDRAVSPISTASSSSEPPLAQRLQRMNGSNHGQSISGPGSSTAGSHDLEPGISGRQYSVSSPELSRSDTVSAVGLILHCY